MYAQMNLSLVTGKQHKPEFRQTHQTIFQNVIVAAAVRVSHFEFPRSFLINGVGDCPSFP